MFLRHKYAFFFSQLVQSKRFASAKSPASREIESAVLALTAKTRNNGYVSLNQFNEILGKVASSPVELLPKTSIALLAACGPNMIDLFPHQRQVHLDRIFNGLVLAHMAAPDLTERHFETYMRNTLANWAHFDPFEITRRMSELNLKGSLAMNRCLLAQLCNSGHIELAVAHLNSLIGKVSFSDFNIAGYSGAGSAAVDLRNLGSGRTGYDARFIEFFNPLLEYFTRSLDSKHVELLDAAERMGLEPNSATYATLVSGYINQDSGGGGGGEAFGDASKLYAKTKARLDFGDSLTVLANLVTAQRSKHLLIDLRNNAKIKPHGQMLHFLAV
jgi:hypothetical protein